MEDRVGFILDAGELKEGSVIQYLGLKDYLLVPYPESGCFKLFTLFEGTLLSFGMLVLGS